MQEDQKNQYRETSQAGRAYTYNYSRAEGQAMHLDLEHIADLEVVAALVGFGAGNLPPLVPLVIAGEVKKLSGGWIHRMLATATYVSCERVRERTSE